jgi:hypothetical protein
VHTHEVVGGGDGVDVTGEVEVELLHGNDLGVAAARSATLDTEGGALAGLPQAGEALLVQVRSQALSKTDGGSRFALTKGRGGDAGHHDVLAVLVLLKAHIN